MIGGRFIAFQNLVETVGRLVFKARGAVDFLGQQFVRFCPGNQKVPDFDHGVLAPAMESFGLVQIVEQVDDLAAPLAPWMSLEGL